MQPSTSTIDDSARDELPGGFCASDVVRLRPRERIERTAERKREEGRKWDAGRHGSRSERRHAASLPRADIYPARRMVRRPTGNGTPSSAGVRPIPDRVCFRSPSAGSMKTERLSSSPTARGFSWMIGSRHVLVVTLCLSAVTARVSGAQAPTTADSIVATLPPRTPLPAEAATAGITRFSFIAYGDTRGRHDGVELQAEHALVIESMLATIKQAAATADPIRFVAAERRRRARRRDRASSSRELHPAHQSADAGGRRSLLPLRREPRRRQRARSSTIARRVAGLAQLLRRERAAHSARRIAAPARRAIRRTPSATATRSSSRSTRTSPTTRRSSPGSRRSSRGSIDGAIVNVVVFFHHPPFSSGPHGGAKRRVSGRDDPRAVDAALPQASRATAAHRPRASVRALGRALQGRERARIGSTRS